jgi:hypothetical protein
MFQKSLLILAIAAAGASAHAQSSPSPSAPSGPAAAQAASPAKQELINRILKIQQGAIDHMAEGLVQEPLGPLLDRAQAALQQRVPADKRQAVAQAIQADTRKYVEETVPLVRDRAHQLAPETIGPILDQKFTEDELRQVVGFLESPVLAKFQAAGLEIQRTLAQKVVADTRGQVEQRFRALEDSMAKRLGVPEGGAPAGKAPAAGAKPPAKK